VLRFEVKGRARCSTESCRRPEILKIERPELGTARKCWEISGTEPADTLTSRGTQREVNGDAQ
jgi:hypothetical protein